MTLMDVFFKIDRVKDISGYEGQYDYWTIDKDGLFVLMTYRNEPDLFTDIKRVNTFDIESCIPYLSGNSWVEESYFIPYEELELYFNVNVEFEELVEFDGGMKYPLVCVRGTCDRKCRGKKMEAYCFRGLPCTNNHPDINVFSCKYPNFYDLLCDIANFIGVCPHTDTLIVMFYYVPTVYEQELSFSYCVGISVKDNKITVIGDGSRVKKLYQEYNKKYPTEDRQIENAISEPEEGFYFKF